MLLEWKWVFLWNISSINIACNFYYVSPIISWHFAYHSGYAVTVAKPFHLEDLVAWNSALLLQQREREFREKCNFPESLANGGWMTTRNDAKEIWGMRETERETFCSVAIQAVTCYDSCQHCPFWFLPLVFHLLQALQRDACWGIQRRVTAGVWLTDLVKSILAPCYEQ